MAWSARTRSSREVRGDDGPSEHRPEMHATDSFRALKSHANERRTGVSANSPYQKILEDAMARSRLTSMGRLNTALQRCTAASLAPAMAVPWRASPKPNAWSRSTTSRSNTPSLASPTIALVVNGKLAAPRARPLLLVQTVPLASFLQTREYSCMAVLFGCLTMMFPIMCEQY